MNSFQDERLVVAFEQIAIALAEINETGKRQFAKQWPERGEVREAVYSRVPSEEDRIREEHGDSDESLEEWLRIRGEEAFGPREREFRERQNARAQAPPDDRSDSGGIAAIEDQT